MREEKTVRRRWLTLMIQHIFHRIKRDSGEYILGKRCFSRDESMPQEAAKQSDEITRNATIGLAVCHSINMRTMTQQVELRTEKICESIKAWNTWDIFTRIVSNMRHPTQQLLEWEWFTSASNAVSHSPEIISDETFQWHSAAFRNSFHAASDMCKNCNASQLNLHVNPALKIQTWMHFMSFLWHSSPLSIALCLSFIDWNPWINKWSSRDNRISGELFIAMTAVLPP